MREVEGDVFAYPADAIVIPTNWTTKRNGNAVMGAGVAKEAARRWPHLPALLGYWIEKGAIGPHVFCDRPSGEPYIVCVPTKTHWRDPSDLNLIEAMARELVVRANDGMDWRTVVLPRLGCGLGGLAWETQVRPLLATILDDRFVVLTPPPRAD